MRALDFQAIEYIGQVPNILRYLHRYDGFVRPSVAEQVDCVRAKVFAVCREIANICFGMPPRSMEEHQHRCIRFTGCDISGANSAGIKPPLRETHVTQPAQYVSSAL